MASFKKNHSAFISVILLLVISVCVLCGAVSNKAVVPTKSRFVSIVDFENSYIHNAKESTAYEFVETITYNLSKSNPAQIYSIDNNGSDLVFSLVDTQAPVNYFVTYGNDRTIDHNPQGGTTGETGVYAEAKADEVVNFGYMLGYKQDPDPQVKSKEPVDSACGKINVYRVKR